MSLRVFGTNPGRVPNLLDAFGQSVHSSAPLVAPQSFEGDYRLIEDNNYVLGLQELRAALPQGNAFHPLISGFPRPLTLKETLQYLIEDFNTLQNADGTPRSIEDRERLFLNYFDTCTGIHYNPGTNKFMIIPCCDRLITFDYSFSGPFVDVPYGTLPGIELDRTQAEYGVLLPKQKVLQHKGWLALFEEDSTLLRAYTNFVFSLKKGNLMAFRLRSNVKSTELLAVWVNSLRGNSSVIGDNNLDGSVRFLLKSPSSSQKLIEVQHGS
jgi:hypothetical protein